MITCTACGRRWAKVRNRIVRCTCSGRIVWVGLKKQ